MDLQKEPFISSVCDMSVFEFLLMMESTGRKMDGKVLENMIFELASSKEWRFLESCFEETEMFDDLLKIPQTMRILLMKDGFTMLMDPISPNGHYRKFSIDRIVSRVLSRRPGIPLKYYVETLKDDFRFYHRKYPGFQRFEEIVYGFVEKFRDDPLFPGDVRDRVENVHFEIYNITSILD